MTNTSYDRFSRQSARTSGLWESCAYRGNTSTRTFFRLLFAPQAVSMGRIRGAGLLVVGLCRHAPALSPSNSRKHVGKLAQHAFQCGKQAAHRRFGAATTTAELEIVFRTGGSQRQCFAVCNPEFRQASNRLRLSGRIVKKLTNSATAEPNRPESRVPKSDADRPGMSILERMVSSPFTQPLSQACKQPTKEFRFKPVKGPFEPWYCGIVEAETERVLEKWWECPHCGQEYKRRVICEQHCKGKQGMYPPHCCETKKGGKCYSGCGHP